MTEHKHHRHSMGVTISAREIYDEIVGLREDVRSLGQHNETVRGELDDHERRIRAIERWKYAVPVVLLSGLFTALVQLNS
ncbi:hypothetical protein [Streptomyces harbinensis]